MSVPDSDSWHLPARGQQGAGQHLGAGRSAPGEVYGYRMDAKMPPGVRAGVTPKRNADRDIGAWNAFEITMRRGDRRRARSRRATNA